MNKFDLIMTQVEKKPFQARIGKWVTLPELKSESDFTDADVVPNQPHSHASNLTYSTVTKQIQKKKPSKKSKRDRVSAIGVLLSATVGK
jgi:hypothetical protein